MYEELNSRGAAIVTGASRGLGVGIARRLAETGRPVVLAARDAAALEDVADGIRAGGGEALVVPADVTDRAAVEQLIAEARERLGAIEIVVNNAGAPPLVAALDAMTWDEWRRNIDVDVRAAFTVTAAVAPHLREHGRGTLVNVAAGAVPIGSADHVSFSPAQAALVSFSRCVAAWLAPSDVAVHCVCPELTPAGGIGVAAAAAFGAAQGLTGDEWLARRFDTPRLTPDEVGDAVVELTEQREGREWWLTHAGLSPWNVLPAPPQPALAR